MIELGMLKRHWVFWVTLFLFILLLAKNPFSVRTLIPNFEPYPDTIHYINSAQSFIRGHGLQIWRERRVLKTTVPPLYSLVLIPAFLINIDARMFYFMNILLALGSFLFFYLTAKNICTNRSQPVPTQKSFIVLFVSLFLYVTNYFIYWYPSLAMAENLALFLFMAGIHVLTLPVTRKHVILAAVISIAFYITKYASIPLTGFYFLSYGLKIIVEHLDSPSESEGGNDKKTKLVIPMKMGIQPKITSLLILILTSFFLFLAYSIWEWQAKGSTLLLTLFSVFLPQKSATLVGSGSWFSMQYLPAHLPEYLKAIRGGYSVRFLWDNTPIVPIFVGVPGLIGLIFGIFKKQTRILSIALSSILLSSILFMSTFYSIDMRYLYHAIPTLLIGFVIFWGFLLSLRGAIGDAAISKIRLLRFARNDKLNVTRYTLHVVLVILFLFSFATSAIRLKKQIMLNIKYAETPWYYLSIVKLNEYFVTLPKKNHKPIVISSLIPYYIDFYNNNTYGLLPLSLEQEFRNNRKEAWGNNDYSNLLSLYKSYLNRGYDVYVHNYGLGNEKKLQNDHDAIHTYFKTSLVSTGCLGACNIWKVNLR